MTIDKEKLIESCRCGHEGCVGDICPFYDEDCPAYICKNELLYAVYMAMKTDKNQK